MDGAADMPSTPWCWVDGVLQCEGVAAAALADRFGTPLYVYSRAAMVERFQRVRAAFGDDTLICFAVKSNSNLSVLRVFGELGAGFDVVSGGELARVAAAGQSTQRTVFAGVGKGADEIDAALAADILFFNVESPFELDLLAARARELGRSARLAVRLNPDVDPQTHAYISTGKAENKFGMDLSTAADVVRRIAHDPALELVGYHVHLGSQLQSEAPYVEALDRIEAFLDGDALRREGVRYFDAGGGFGVSYALDAPPMPIETVAAALLPRLRARGLQPVIEPGRYLVADAGVLLTQVLGTKPSGERRFVIVDAAMTELLRPALYGAVHPIEACTRRSGPVVRCEVVGPVCESGDFLGKDVPLSEPVVGDRLAVFGAGAYAATMASNYNSRPRAAEVLVSGADARVVRRRERVEDLWAAELPESRSERMAGKGSSPGD